MVIPDDHQVVAQLTHFEQLTAGAIAGGVAKTVIAPADRVKILYQVNPSRSFSLGAAFKSARVLVRNAGVRGLWRGHGANLIRVMPYSSISFMTFDRYKMMLKKYVTHEEDVRSRFSAGALAGITASTMTYPLDLMRARMAAHWDLQPKYNTYRSACRVIVEKEGLRALWNGLAPTLLGIIPYAGISFATFGTLKSHYKKRHGLRKDTDIPTPTRLLCGGFSGLLAQSMTYPLDIVRRRMQVGTRGTDIYYKSIGEAITRTYGTEGLSGLYKGLSMNWLKGPVAVSVSFLVNDQIKGAMRDMHESNKGNVF